MKKKIWLCDLDGTLALMNGRGPFEWDKVGEDLPNEPVIEVVGALMDFWDVGFVSGRAEQCREQTRLWLLAHLCAGGELWMRADGDYRPDEIVKREIYENQIAPHYEVLGVFDDRSKVVRMWRELGLTCFQVAEGKF